MARKPKRNHEAYEKLGLERIKNQRLQFLQVLAL